MATVKFGNFIVDARGSIAGNTLSRSKGCAVIRRKAKAPNPRTAQAQRVRARFALLSQLWRNLTQAQRDAWNRSAPQFSRVNSIGDTIQISGFNLYIELNSRLNISTAPFINVPPAPRRIMSNKLISLLIRISTDTFQINFTPANNGARNYTFLYATPPLSPGRKNVTPKLAMIGTLSGGSGSGNNVAGFYKSKYGNLGHAGQKIYMKIYNVDIDTGLRSASSILSAIVLL